MKIYRTKLHRSQKQPHQPRQSPKPGKTPSPTARPPTEAQRDATSVLPFQPREKPPSWSVPSAANEPQLVALTRNHAVSEKARSQRIFALFIDKLDCRVPDGLIKQTKIPARIDEGRVSSAEYQDDFTVRSEIAAQFFRSRERTRCGRFGDDL